MTVKELIAALQDFDGDLVVVVQATSRRADNVRRVHWIDRGAGLESAVDPAVLITAEGEG